MTTLSPKERHVLRLLLNSADISLKQAVSKGLPIELLHDAYDLLARFDAESVDEVVKEEAVQ